MRDPSRIIDALSHSGYEFLISDAALALTLTRIASQADGDKRMRNLYHAHRAYQKIRELAPRLYLTGEQQQRVSEELTTLKSALERAGQPV